MESELLYCDTPTMTLLLQKPNIIILLGGGGGGERCASHRCEFQITAGYFSDVSR